LTALAVLLATRYSVSPLSDPARWFAFGRNFAAEFASRELAYGFPLLLAGAIEVVGPYRAFLVNIPLLVLVGAALYLFARECARAAPEGVGPGGPASAALAGALALALFVYADPAWIVHLANPYRDPLAFLCTLVSGILTLRFVSGRTRRLWWLALAGGALAYAGSTRETSVLFLGPLLLFAALSRRRDPGIPFARASLVFGVAFGVAAIPFLVQNHLVSGQALVPGQAAHAFEKSASLAPGIRLASLTETLPEVVRYLAAHFGPGGLALMGIGLVAAGIRRNLAILALCAPAMLVYGLFYAGYDRVVPRYLLVVDLFALPIAGAGLGFLLDLAVARISRPRAVARIAVAAGFALAVSASLLGRSATIEQRVRVDGIERFVERVKEMIPEGAQVLGGRPAIDVLYTFLPNRVTNIANLVPSRRLEDPDLPGALRRLVEESGEVWFVSRYDAARILVQREYDLVRAGRLQPREYGLERPLRGENAVLIDRVLPWQLRSVTLPIVANEQGPHVLSLDLGHLSQHSRNYAKVRWGETLIDEDPSDGVNFYAVEVSRAGAPLQLRIESDRPLPSRPEARLLPADKKLTLDFSAGAGPRHRERLSDSFRKRPKLPHPTIERRGTLLLPTPAPRNVVFLVDIEADLPMMGERYARIIEGWVGGHRVLRGRRTVQPRTEDGERDGFTLSLTLSDREVTGKDTALELRMLEDPSIPEPRLLSLRSVSLRRYPLADAYVLDLSAERIPAAFSRGFYAPHPRFDRDAPPGRWTGEAASARLFLRDAPGPANLEVVYWLGGRPGSAAPAAPEFRILGRKLQGRKVREDRDGDTRVVERFEIPSSWGLRPAEVLEMRATPWVPGETGVSADPRALGVRMESISIARKPGAPLRSP
jgi:hypothetical protein